MADVPLDDAASFDAFGARLAPPSPGSSAPAANPFDGFEDFAAPAANALSLPPPTTAVSLGSPLISFSPLAVAPATTDAPALASSSSSNNNNAVDDLLSFSPVATAPLSAGPSSFLTIDDFFLSSTAATTSSALSNDSSSGGVGVFDAIDISSSTVESGSSPSVSTLPQTEQMKAPGFDTFEAAEENVRGSSSGDNVIQNSSLLGETSFAGDSGHLPLSPLPTQLDLLATTPFNSLEVTGETARDSFGGFDMIKEPSSINETGHLSPSPLLTQTDLLDVTEETGRGSFGGFDMTKGSRPINETGQLSPTPLPTQTGALAPSTFDSLDTTTENVRGSYVGLDMVPRSESDLESPLTSSTNSLPTIPATSDAVAPLGVNSSVADTQVIDSNIHNVRIEVQVTETTVSVSEIVSAETGSERSEAPTVFAESRASSPSVSVDTLQAQTVPESPESSTGDFISSDSVHVEMKTASVAVVQNESQTIGRDSDDQDQELRVDSDSPKDPVKFVEHTHTLDTKVNGDGSSELDADIHAEEIAPDATRSQEAFAQQPLIGSEKVTLEPIVGQEVHSALSFHNTPSEDDPRDLSEHGVDDFEGDFEAEFHAIDAEVADGVENTSLKHVESHESPMHIHIRELHSPPANNVALSPSSVVSSPGSSVEGSAFAFISAGTSAALPFSQTENSPLEKEPEDISDDFAHRESIDNEIYPNASVDDHDDEVVSAQDSLLEGANQSENIARDSQEVIGFANEFGVYGEVHDQNSGTLVGDKEESAEQVDPGSKPFDESVSSSDFGGFEGGFVSNEWSDSVAVTSDAPTASFGFETFSSSTVNETSGIGADDDDFGGFAQSTTTAVDEGDDDFGDFGTASSWGGGGVAIGNDDDDDDFGDFTPSTTSQQWDTVVANSTPSPEWTPTPEPPKPDPIPTDMNHFFGVAFPASKAPYAASLIPKPTSFHSGSTSAISALSILEQTSALHKNFHASLQEYRSLLAGDNDDSNHHHYQPPFEAEAVRLKYLKYVLTEKLSEASRHDGVFPQGSEQYRLYEAIAESGHEKNMREALSKLQEALFHSSVNEAVMRIARQAALSAKARIAEQAAQQQAHARGSLLATTRNFLSRGSNEKDRTASGSLGVLTPTGASVHKISRFSSNGQEGEGQSSGYGSGEDTGSDISAGDSSNFSESDLGVGASPPTSTSSSGRSGGLMKKFHERFSFSSSTKNKQRTVSLRRMGQSNEEVCKMELNMESINGGFDEVKWRCAGFLYETEDVARLAPSQIKIYSYPSNQLLTGKTDRSALSKFFKPGTIWSIDIGVSSE